MGAKACGCACSAPGTIGSNTCKGAGFPWPGPGFPCNRLAYDYLGALSVSGSSGVGVLQSRVLAVPGPRECAPWSSATWSNKTQFDVWSKRVGANGCDGACGRCRVQPKLDGSPQSFSQPMCYLDHANPVEALCEMPGIFTLLLSKDTPEIQGTSRRDKTNDFFRMHTHACQVVESTVVINTTILELESIDQSVCLSVTGQPPCISVSYTHRITQCGENKKRKRTSLSISRSVRSLGSIEEQNSLLVSTMSVLIVQGYGDTQPALNARIRVVGGGILVLRSIAFRNRNWGPRNFDGRSLLLVRSGAFHSLCTHAASQKWS